MYQSNLSLCCFEFLAVRVCSYSKSYRYGVKTYPICGSSLKISACEQKLYPVWFPRRRKNYTVFSVNIT